MFSPIPFQLFGLLIVSFLVLRFLYKSSLLYVLSKWWRWFQDACHVYQFYKVPQFNEHMQENQLYRKVSAYLNSLASVEDSDFANLMSGNKSKEINVGLDPDRPVSDTFLGARVVWRNEKSEMDGSRALVLKVRRTDRGRILRPYLQHIHSVFDEIERKEVRLYVNTEPERNGWWRSVPFNHPATIETVVMDSDVKNKVKSDLESFLKSKQYYHRLGRVWKRSYLLYGSPGTGKSSFVAGMAKFLRYDVYDIDLSKVSADSDLKMLLLQTTNKSMIVIEHLDRFLAEKPTAVSLAGILNFMDGILSCCGEERVMVFTMHGKDQIDPTVLRPGRIDVHVHFPLCDFSAFKSLASSHLGIKEHKLFAQVEEMFQRGSSLSPAEICQIMISNRTSSSRALKAVITALQLQTSAENSESGRLSKNASGRGPEESGETKSFFNGESVHMMKDLGKLYGLLRMRSRRKSSDDMDLAEKENSQHGTSLATKL
ncbi:AAA-ATPase At2g46620-like [Diospyros lotus]|uniref:AAA-ATPase At2g46620-like n=1 Tax=Diospyros lotus TaxID=55363 RepID=UPI002253F111|nr:AAA-ATPase At2g46620-like [Diospyros lotus]